MKIDFHTHLFPLPFLKEIERRNLAFGMGGESFTVFESMYDPIVRFRDMEEYGVDMQVLSVGPPGVELEGASSEVNALLARIANDEIARLVAGYPERFLGLASLPLRAPEEAVGELERAVKSLGLKGAIIFSNVDGKMLDSPDLEPLFAKAVELDVPLFIHPTTPVFKEWVRDYGLTIMVGLLFDSTLALCRLIFSGLLERYPTLKLIVAHLGSTLPYIEGRLDVESGLLGKFVPGYRLGIPKPPSEYVKRIYMDTVSHHRPAYMCAYASSGADKILLGSDYPYSRWQRTVQAVEELPIPEADKEKIFYQNVRNLLKLA